MLRIYMLMALVCASLAFVSAVHYQDCGSKEGRIVSISVEGCETSNTCTLKRGSNTSITIQFQTGEVAAHSVNAVVHGIIQGLPVPFSVPNPDACTAGGGGLTCPLKPHTSYTYTNSLPIKKMYPAIHVMVQWELQDQGGSDIVCVKIPTQIK